MIGNTKGRIVYKSKTRKSRKGLLLYIIFAIIFDYFFIQLLWFFILILTHVPFPDSLLPSVWFLFGLIPTGLLGLSFTLLVILKFITFLKIYENGIEIRLISVIPPKWKKIYISYAKITKVELIKDKFGSEDIYFYITDREPYKLSEYHIDDLKKTRNLILKNKSQKNNTEINLDA